MKKKKILLAGIAAVLCVLFTTPCFGSASQQSAGAPAGSGSGIDSNMNLTGLPIVNQKETYNILMARAVNSGNTMPEKEPVKKAEQDTNVIINWIEVPAANYQERLQIMMASGDFPDGFIGGGAPFLAQNFSILTDLTDLITKYSPNLTNYLKTRPDIRSNYIAPDGRMYTLPAGNENPDGATAEALYFNTAWLKQLNMPMPVTTDDFYTILKAFKDNDMNGNGDKNDEIPFAFCEANGQTRLGSMFGSFGTLDNTEHLMVKNDTVIFTPAMPEFLAALRYFNKLYSEGLMDPEGFSQSQQQYTAKGRQNPLVYGSFINYDRMNMVGNALIDNYIYSAPLKGPGGVQLWNRSRGIAGVFYGLSITKKCSSPEVLVRWYDYVNSSYQITREWEGGPEGFAWIWDSNGVWQRIDTNVPAGSSWGEYRHTLGVGTAGPQFGTMYSPPPSPDQMAEKGLSLQLQLPFLPKAIPTGLEEAGVVQERSIWFADIDTYVKTFVASSIMNGITDDQWNAHLRNCDRLPVTKYVASYQDHYDKTRQRKYARRYI